MVARILNGIHACGRGLALAAFIVFLSTGLAAFAAEDGAQAPPSEVLFLAQILLLLLAGRLLGEAMQRIGQSAVIGQLLTGILLGPSVLGAIWPAAQHVIFAGGREQKSMIDAVSQLGILMLLLLTGMETDLKLVKKAGRAAVSASAAGIILPFASGFALGEFLPVQMLPRPEERLVTALFLGTALSIASVKVVAMVVREMNFLRRNVGIALLASAIIDDTVGWIIVALTLSLAAHGRVDSVAVGQSVLGTGLFLLLSFTLGRRIVFSFIRWTNDNFISEAPVLTAILVIMAAMALITYFIGVHTVLGAFVAGILIGESPILTRRINEQLRGLVVALFMPVFFSLAGLNADLTILKDPDLMFLTLGLILIASIGKFSGAFVGGALGGLTRRESLALGCGMNARGSTEVIVASIGLSMGALSQDLFTMIVAMAIVTTMAMPPTLRWALSRLPLREEERVRLDREAFDAKGFVTRLERLLIAVDDSANATLALHLARLLARSRGIPTTVLRLEGSETSKESKPSERGARAPVLETDPEEAGPMNLNRSLRAKVLPSDVAVAKEARKGYSLLVVGIAQTMAPHGEFDEEISRIAANFEGPLAVVVARGAHTEHPPQNGLKILAPVRGNDVSRRAAEVALALARGSNGKMTALYVLGTAGLGAAHRGLKRATASRRHEEAVLKDIVELADRDATPIRTTLRLDIAPEDAILRQARLGSYDLIVMGVSRPAGETLFFGKAALAVLENSQHSILFVSS
ncbi:MAG TPA: cation:proton antiporter [Methylocella sp.]|nr:cation:proton antiporter [Methylocella sp.]